MNKKNILQYLIASVQADKTAEQAVMACPATVELGQIFRFHYFYEFGRQLRELRALHRAFYAWWVYAIRSRGSPGTTATSNRS